MMQKDSAWQHIRKLNILQDRIDGLIAIKKDKEALKRQKHHFHLATSFSVILFLHDTMELFNITLSAAVSNFIC